MVHSVWCCLCRWCTSEARYSASYVCCQPLSRHQSCPVRCQRLAEGLPRESRLEILGRSAAGVEMVCTHNYLPHIFVVLLYKCGMLVVALALQEDLNWILIRGLEQVTWIS